MVFEDNNLEVNSGLKLIAKSSGVVFLCFFLSKLLTYVYRIIIARQFGPEIYGTFSLALMISGWFMVFSALGLGEGLLRYISLYRGKSEIAKINYVLKFVLKVSFFSGLFFSALLYFSADLIAIDIFHNTKLVFFLKIFSLLVFTSTLTNPFLLSLRAFEKIKLYSFLQNIVPNVIKVSFLLTLIFFGLGENSIIFSYVGGALILSVLSFFIFKYTISKVLIKNTLSKKTQDKVSSKLVSYSLPLLLFGAIAPLFYWIDSFSIGYFKSAFEVGLYNSAVPIAMLFLIASSIFIQLFFPLVTREYAKNNMNSIKEISKQVGKWIFILNLPILILLVLFSQEVINLLFGYEYTLASITLIFLSFGTFISSIFVISNQLLSMAGKSKIILFDMILAASLNIILNSLLVPMDKILFLDNSLGINGAAISTLISMTFFSLLFAFQAKHYLSIVPLRRKMILIAGASLIPTVLLVYIKKTISLNFYSITAFSLLFLILYAGFVLLFNGLDKNDFVIINSIKRKLFKKS